MMNKLDWNHIDKLVEQHYLKVQKHPEADLYICNYTAKTQYDAFWNDYTSMCRGLIIDEQGNIVARPFPKFFNLEQVKPQELPQESFQVYEKLDGSLGILYWLKGKPQLATRGSFVGEQAKMANEMLEEKYQHTLDKLDPNNTYLFEIIYPGNRIVVDYGQISDLFLLAIIETKTGVELPLHDIGFPIVEHYEAIHDLTGLHQHAKDNREGFVIRFASGMRVKVKFSEYIRLHRIVTELSLIEIWQYLSEGKPLDELLEKVPDEVFDWVKQSVTELQTKYDAIEEACQGAYKEFPTRKETAQYFQQQKHPQVLFAMLTGKNYAPIIWKMVRPEGKQTYFNKILDQE